MLDRQKDKIKKSIILYWIEVKRDGYADERELPGHHSLSPDNDSDCRETRCLPMPDKVCAVIRTVASCPVTVALESGVQRNVRGESLEKDQF